MLRKRERFERTDVPRATPLRSVVSAVALVAVAFGLYLLVTTLWHRANQVNGFGDRSLKAAVRAQAAPAGPPEGYVASDHEFTTILGFTTTDNAVTSAQLLSLDTTDGRGTLVNLPLDLRVTSEEVILPLSTLYGLQGATACIAPVSAATNVKVSHVVVADDDVWGQLERLRGLGLANLLGSAADMLETINTDMTTSDLFSLAETVRGIGLGNLSRIDAPVVPEQLEDGTPVSAVDQTQLLVQLGMLVAPAPAEPEAGEEAPAEASGGGGEPGSWGE